MKIHDRLSKEEKRALYTISDKAAVPKRTRRKRNTDKPMSRSLIEELMGVHRYTPRKSKGNGRVLR